MEHFDDFVTDRSLKRVEVRRWLDDKSNLGKMYKDKFIPFHTSGTTGQNALVVYDRNALDHVHAAVVARHPYPNEPTGLEQLGIMLRNVFIRKARLASVMMTGGPYPAYTAALFAPKFHDVFIKSEIFSLLEPIDRIVERLNEFQPDSMFAYPSLLELLAREQLEGRLKISFGLPTSTLSTGSEPLSETTRKLARKAWNMEIQDTYGTAECFIMARSCGKFERMHVMTDLCIFEVVDRHYNPVPDGQTGEKVLLTNLFNYVQPFIRYEVSDVTGFSLDPCSCDMPFPTLLPVEGRTDDIFYVDRPGGGYEAVHPYLFLGPIVELDEVREYQLVQTGRNEVTFSYVPESAGEDIGEKVRHVLQGGIDNANLNGRVKLMIERIDSIPRDPKSGKYRQIVSRVGAPADLDERERVNH